MKKKIAIFANTWNSDILSMFLNEFRKDLPEDSFDTFVFLAANSYGRPEENNKSECTIHTLPYLEDYACAIVFSQGLNSVAAREEIYDACQKAGVPTICIGDSHSGFYSVNVDNAHGMRELCEHLYEEHGARKFVFMGGPTDNDDSNLRLEVLREFAKEKNLPFSDDDVHYTDWEVRKAMEFVTNRYSTKENLPDVFICANDFLAISITIAMEVYGISVPDDVYVTGFDYVKSGRTYYPSIATVNQRYDMIGSICAKTIVSIEEGKDIPKTQYTSSGFIAGESCGCHSPRQEDELRKQYCHSLVGKEYQDNSRMGVIYGVRAAFQDSGRLSTLPQKLQDVIYNSDNLDIQNTYLMLDPILERVATEETRELPQLRFSEKMQVVLARRNGEPLDVKNLKRRELIPDYQSEGSNNIYFMMPLYIDTFVCGYFVMLYNDISVRDWIYQEFESCILQSLTYYKTNIRLTALNDKLSELMQTDALTSLKNRTAFENAKAVLRNHYLSQDNQRFAAVMFDLNNLKKINDELGHGAGDIYIKNSSELICNTFKHSPVFRIGGDEFVAIVKNSDYPERYELLEKFRSEVERLSNADVPPMKRVSVASGMADFDEIENEDIDTLFKKADERMYENKRLMKAGRN
ncbi:MAG: GGDEF domain-containing protein [Lachnospiraceae bacterium]|nr:GGDEF domain-containing protein [Lachnospiraceae bacterium]